MEEVLHGDNVPLLNMKMPQTETIEIIEERQPRRIIPPQMIQNSQNPV